MSHAVLTAGEIAVPFSPESYYLPREMAILKFREVMEVVVDRKLYRSDCPRLTETVYNNLSSDPNASFPNKFGFAATLDAFPVWIRSEQATDEMIMKLLKLYAYYMERVDHESEGLSILTNVCISICKQGTVSADFVKKTVDAMKAELDKDILINRITIRNIWDTYGQHIDETNVGALIEHFLKHISSEAVRLRIILQQASFSGLTMYQTIGRALIRYKDFDWGIISKITPRELEAFNNATTAINGNPYYGFKKDIGFAKASNFRTLGYIAKELLMKLDGKTHLKYQKVFNIKPPHIELLNESIEKYIHEVTTSMWAVIQGTEQAPKSIHKEPTDEAALKALEGVLNNLDMFKD